MHVVAATPLHVIEMATAPEPLRLTLPPSVYRCLLAQLVVGDAFAVYEHERATSPLLVAGLAPIDKASSDCWFLVRPGGLGLSLLRVVRLVRAELDARQGDLLCFVRHGNESGERLARALGFVPQERAIGEYREWRR